MGYDMWINDHSITFKGSEDELKARLVAEMVAPDSENLTFWEIDVERRVAKPIDYNFRWGGWFIDELKTLSELGFEGYVEVVGEQGDYYKYVLREGWVEEYYGEVVYSPEPNNIY